MIANGAAAGALLTSAAAATPKMSAQASNVASSMDAIGKQMASMSAVQEAVVVGLLRMRRCSGTTSTRRITSALSTRTA